MDAAHKDHSLVKAPWLLLLETDYVWAKPLLVSCCCLGQKLKGKWH
jgi:hypothetical protein